MTPTKSPGAYPAPASTDAVIEQLVAVLREAFEGPAQAWSYFASNSPDAGMFGTLGSLSAEAASKPWGGSSIAAHVHHVNFALAATANWIRGDRSRRDWKESWTISEVDAEAWSGLLDRMRGEYEELRRAIESYGGSSVEAVGGAVAAVAHSAYHLGAIRQKIAYSKGA